MKALIICLILATLSGISAAAMPNYIYAEAPVKHFKPEDRPDIYYGPERAMKAQILLYKGQNKKTNHFCAMGLVWANGDIRMPVFWHEKKMLFFDWDGASNDLEAVSILRMLQKSIDYEKDVVSTREEVGLSTYLQVRSDVQALLRDCEKYGKKYVIKPFMEPKICPDPGGCGGDNLGIVLNPIPKDFFDEPYGKFSANGFSFKFTEISYPKYAPETPLKAQILRHKGQNKKTNHFCTIGLSSHYGTGSGMSVFWYEKKLLVFLQNTDDEEAAITAMATLKGVPYDRDVVVETQTDFPYIYTRSGMNKLLRDCEEHGEKFTIEPFKAPKRCTDWEKCEDKLGWQPIP